MTQNNGCASLNSNKRIIQEAVLFCPECAENQFTTSITLNYFYWFKLKYIMGKEWGKGSFNRLWDSDANKDFPRRFQAYFPSGQ